MKKKILAMMLSLTMVLNTFSVAGAAEVEFTDGEVSEAMKSEEVMFDEEISEEAELFGDGDMVIDDNEVPAADIPPEPEVETVRIGDDVTATITYNYEELFEPGNYYKVASEVVITGTGDTWDYLDDGYDDEEGTNKNPFRGDPYMESWVTVTIENGITSIGDRLFWGCGIKEITIPESVVSIGKAAFCAVAFKSDVILSENIVELGESAFEGAFFNGESKLIHEGGIEIIPDSAFKGCRNLKVFDFQGVQVIGDSAFEGTDLSVVEFSDSLKEIGHRAFSACRQLKSIKIPDTVEQIIGQAFSQCTALTEVTLPNNEFVLSGTFQDCMGLQSITIPESVKTLSETFRGCSRLLNVIIKGKKTEMGEFDPFEDCPRLQSISGYDCSYAKKYADTREKIEFKSLGTGAHEWSTDKTVDKQPNCTELGSKSNHCVICDEKRNEEEISALGHDWGNAVIIKEPTEIEEGLIRYTCWRCGASKVETIPPVGQAGSIQVGDNVWATINGGTLTLTGSGETYNDFNSSSWCNNREDIQEVIIDKNITVGN